MPDFKCLDVKATQTKFGKLVGVSQQAISDRIYKGDLKDGGTLLQWLQQYCDKLREEAAGRSGEDRAALTKARTRETNISADLKEQQMMEKAGLLVPADENERMYAAMVAAARSELLTLPDKLSNELKALYDIDVDPALITEHIYAALNHLANTNPSDLDPDDGAGDEAMGAAA